MASTLISRLEQTQRQLDELGPLLSLSPSRRQATPLPELGQRLLGRLHEHGVDDAELEQELVDGICGIASSIARNFPENQFWDLDFLAMSLMSGATRGERAGHIREAVSLIVSLQDLFGGSTTICFRYAHDFLYGFDWAKWVARAPTERSGTGPFDLEFLRYMRRRGSELLELIANDDSKYPQIPQGAKRNPFSFVRDPEQERALHRDLAAQRLVPVEAWRLDATPSWDRPFAELRAQRAHALGFARPV